MPASVKSYPTCNYVAFGDYDWSFQPALTPVSIPCNPIVYCLIAAFCAVSLWMTIELTVQIYFTFKRHTSLYYWSILVCTWGIAFHVIALLLKLYNKGNWIVSSIIFKIGWVSNVTGFSLVLYARLHLIVRNRRILRTVLSMIVVDAILLHTPIIVTDFGISSPHPEIWVTPMRILERIQVLGFSIQETIISMLYIYHAAEFLKGTYKKKTRWVMQSLIFVQMVSMFLDVALIALDYNDMFTLKVIIHPFVYTIKLKLEFLVLNQLLALIKPGLAPRSIQAPDEVRSPLGSEPPSEKDVSFLPSDKGTATTAAKPGGTGFESAETRGSESQLCSLPKWPTHNHNSDQTIPTNLSTADLSSPIEIII